MKRYCEYCGKEIGEAVVFCPYCGSNPVAEYPVSPVVDEGVMHCGRTAA